MLKKLLTAVIFGSTFFCVSYSMEKKQEDMSSANVSLTGIEKKVTAQCVGQCYEALDAQIRACSRAEETEKVFGLVDKFANEVGDVCMNYHLCRVAYESVRASGLPQSSDLEKMQERFIFILARVYVDVAASLVIAENSEDAEHCASIYNLFRSKVKDVWNYQIITADSDFGKLTSAALGHLGKILMRLPSNVWVYFCQKSSLSTVGLYTHTVYFGNVDNRYDFVYRENAKAIGLAKIAAFEKIKNKLQAIATGEKSNQQAWTEFLSLAYKDI
ncbi:MAG: hypothetical protein WC192_04345 [Candidatus Babeliales bacterium]